MAGPGVFSRGTGYTLEQGRMVRYLMVDHQGQFMFQILAHRDGVQVQGSLNIGNGEGIRALTTILKRASRHHEHLKSYPVGTPQTVLDEHILIAEERAESASKEFSYIKESVS